MKKNLARAVLIGLAGAFLWGCSGEALSSAGGSSFESSPDVSSQTSSSSPVGSSASASGEASSSSSASEAGVYYYSAEAITHFGSGTPSGTANYEAATDSAVIWNTSATLDNYGGVQTPTLPLDFSHAVYFEMQVRRVFTEYIVKLAVAGESETYYVLADENALGIVSVNVVDAMLCDKFRARNTQPDPGYATGWKYAGETVNCSFHILAKGPDGERETAELALGYVKISNNQAAVTGVSVSSPALTEGRIARLKGSDPVSLTAAVEPSSIPNQNIIWSSDDPSIAPVDANGNVSFLGVGITKVWAKSQLDQSKAASVEIDVLSGYENVNDLRAKLASLSYGGSASDAEIFNDLYATSWNGSFSQTPTISPLAAIASHAEGVRAVAENSFDPANASEVSEAESHSAGGVASFAFALSGASSATVYRSIGGKLYAETYAASLKAAYAVKNGTWSKADPYVEKAIVAKGDGTAFRYELELRNIAPIGSYAPSDMMDSAQWVVPDRTKLSADPTVNALSPATRSLIDGTLVLKQNKYPESKYCFGGIVSTPLVSEEGKSVQTLIDVASVNALNDYVITMWEIRILYYQSDGITPVSPTPIKVDGANKNGFFTHVFTPAYNHFRLYLVVNGSDIGAQFPDAEIRLNSLKLYSII